MPLGMPPVHGPKLRNEKGTNKRHSPVCTENLNPNVVVMKSAQDGVRTYDAGSLDRTRDRRILVQRPMRSNAVVIGRIVFQNAAQMHLAQYNDVVQTFPPDRSDQPFGKAILPR